MKKVIKSKKTGKSFIVENETAYDNSLIECFKNSEDFEVRDFQADIDNENIFDVYIKKAAGKWLSLDTANIKKSMKAKDNLNPEEKAILEGIESDHVREKQISREKAAGNTFEDERLKNRVKKEVEIKDLPNDWSSCRQKEFPSRRESTQIQNQDRHLAEKALGCWEEKEMTRDLLLY